MDSLETIRRDFAQSQMRSQERRAAPPAKRWRWRIAAILTIVAVIIAVALIVFL